MAICKSFPNELKLKEVRVLMLSGTEYWFIACCS